MVHLTVQLSSDEIAKFNLVTVSGPIANYSVPTTASLVVTTVAITPALDNTSSSFSLHLGGGSDAMNWEIPGQPNLTQFATIQFNYPSGIVINLGFPPLFRWRPMAAATTSTSTYSATSPTTKCVEDTGSAAGVLIPSVQRAAYGVAAAPMQVTNTVTTHETSKHFPPTRPRSDLRAVGSRGLHPHPSARR